MIQQIHRLNNTLDPPLTITVPEVRGPRPGNGANLRSPMDNSWMLSPVSRGFKDSKMGVDNDRSTSTVDENT